MPPLDLEEGDLDVVEAMTKLGVNCRAQAGEVELDRALPLKWGPVRHHPENIVVLWGLVRGDAHRDVPTEDNRLGIDALGQFLKENHEAVLGESESREKLPRLLERLANHRKLVVDPHIVTEETLQERMEVNKG